MTQADKTKAVLRDLAPDSAHSDVIAQRYASHARDLARKLDAVIDAVSANNARGMLDARS